MVVVILFSNGGGFHKCKLARVPRTCCRSQLAWGGNSQVLLRVASEGVEAEVVINAVSSQKVLIIHHDVAKCHKTHFLSSPSPDLWSQLLSTRAGSVKTEGTALLLWRSRRCQHLEEDRACKFSFLSGLKSQMGDFTVGRISLVLLDMTRRKSPSLT